MHPKRIAVGIALALTIAALTGAALAGSGTVEVVDTRCVVLAGNTGGDAGIVMVPATVDGGHGTLVAGAVYEIGLTASASGNAYLQDRATLAAWGVDGGTPTATEEGLPVRADAKMYALRGGTDPSPSTVFLLLSASDGEKTSFCRVTAGGAK